MSRPVVGIIGNSYLMNDQYPTHAGGTMNSDAVANVVNAESAVYKIELLVQEEQYMGVVARPRNHQLRDRDCADLTLGRQGQRGVSGRLAGHPQRCW